MLLGIGSFGVSTQSPGTESEIVNEPVEDDAQTKFYKQHMVRSQPPEMADRATARDLDVWAAERTSECFHQEQNLKRVRQQRRQDAADAKFRGTQSAYVGFFVCFCFVCAILHERSQSSYQNPVTNEN